MNQLNQILLEGAIVDKKALTTLACGNVFCEFTLRNIKYSKNFASEKEEISYDFSYDFPVFTTGKMAEIVSKKPLGTKLRVVGTLAVMSGKMVVKADHIKFKPDLTQNNLE